MKTIGIIGLGNMGYPIYKAIEKENQYKVLGFDPYTDKKDFISRPNLEELVNDSDILILSVKPDKISSVLNQISKAKIILSIAAGVSLQTLKNHSPENSKIIRLMPNLPILVEEASIGYIGDSEYYSEVKKIFGGLGSLYEISNEELFDAFTALCGSGPAFVFSFVQALAEGAVKSGFTYTDALKLSIQTVKGSILYLENEYYKNQSFPIELRNRVSSPAGTTIFGLSEWEKNATSYSISESIYQATLRGKEIKKNSVEKKDS